MVYGKKIVYENSVQNYKLNINIRTMKPPDGPLNKYISKLWDKRVYLIQNIRLIQQIR